MFMYVQICKIEYLFIIARMYIIDFICDNDLLIEINLTNICKTYKKHLEFIL